MASVPVTDYEGGITALAFGNNRVFIAMEEDIYYYDHGTGAWTLGYSYPEGTQINVMYYDELLVGTGTGLYAHSVFGETASTSSIEQDLAIEVYPNPAREFLTVRTDMQRGGSLELLDVAGRVAMTVPVGTEVVRMNIGHLPSGQYLLRWVDNQGTPLGMSHVMKH